MFFVNFSSYPLVKRVSHFNHEQHVIFYSKFAKDRYHINSIQKKFENMYLIRDSSDINSVFSIQLQNK